MTRIKDVARAAGVSPATVSRVLNNKTVKPHLRTAVMAAIAELDYRPNPLARALRSENASFGPPFIDRAVTNLAAKRAIARFAADAVCHYSIVYVDAGSTTMQVVPTLRDRFQGTLITNSIPLAMELTECPAIEVVLLGGSIIPNIAATISDNWESTLRHYPKGPLLMGTSGMDMTIGGPTSFHPATVASKRSLLRHADQAFLLADSRKWDIQAPLRFAQFAEFYRIITDDGIPDALRQRMLDEGIPLTVIHHHSRSQ